MIWHYIEVFTAQHDEMHCINLYLFVGAAKKKNKKKKGAAATPAAAATTAAATAAAVEEPKGAEGGQDETDANDPGTPPAELWNGFCVKWVLECRTDVFHRFLRV